MHLHITLNTYWTPLQLASIIECYESLASPVGSPMLYTTRLQPDHMAWTARLHGGCYEILRYHYASLRLQKAGMFV